MFGWLYGYLVVLFGAFFAWIVGFLDVCTLAMLSDWKNGCLGGCAVELSDD